MKTIVLMTGRVMHSLIYCLFPLSLFIILYTPVKAHSGSVLLIKDTILINKSQTSKKYKIRLYTGATQEVLFFTARGETGKVYQLFLFDLDGTLVKQTQIRNKQTTMLANFNKGNYMFEVFSDDERIENGTMEVR
jgi:hypothetical protein